MTGFQANLLVGCGLVTQRSGSNTITKGWEIREGGSVCQQESDGGSKEIPSNGGRVLRPDLGCDALSAVPAYEAFCSTHGS
jgi:hypothetical protein